MSHFQDAPLPPELNAISSLADLFAWRVHTTPGALAYRQFDAAAGRWMDLSWQLMGEKVDRHIAAMAMLGMGKGARVGILLPNGVETVCFDQATLALGCVPVPMHALDNPASIAYILADSETTLLVVHTLAQWRAIESVGVALPALRQVVVVTPDDALAAAPANVDGPQVVGVEPWLASGGGRAEAWRAQASPQAQDLAGLVYTSGTTGKPKGVMLTHRNVLANVYASYQRMQPRTDDMFLSFLPLSHTFERTAGYYLPIAAGACVAFARSVPQLAEDLTVVRPTILVSVPRIYERVHAALQAKLAGSPLKQRLFNVAQQVGWRRFCRVQGVAVDGGAPAWLDALSWPLLDKLVAKPLQARFGGRLRVAVSGGAPLAVPLSRCFLGLGLPIVQGYGMTESAPVIAVNGVQDNAPATVGRPLAGVEVRIGDNKELLVRGPNVMRGYWKREEDTARAIGADGWLHTGDQAAIEDGRVRILGRVKEIIVTSTGEKIAPVDLELAITSDPLFEQAYAFGDNRQFIACIVVLARAEWQRLAAEQGLDPADPASLRAAPAREAALKRIKALTHSFPHYAQPRAVALTLEPWTPENTFLTPTLKLKRTNLTNHFAEVIEQLYMR